MFTGHKEASRVIWGYVTIIGVLILAFIGYLIFKPSFEKKILGTWNLYEIRIDDAIDSVEYLYQYNFYSDNTATLTTKLNEEDKEKMYNYKYELDGNKVILKCNGNKKTIKCTNNTLNASFKGNKLVLEANDIKEYYYKSNGY